MRNYTLSTDVRLTHKYPIEILKSDDFICEVRTVFINIGTLYLNNKTLYKKLVDNDLLYVYFPDELYSDDYWNEQTCYEISKIFTSVEDFYRCYPKAYETCVENEWIKTYEWIIDRNVHPCGYWSEEKVKRLVQRKQYKTRREFAEDEPGAFHCAKRNKLLDSLIPKFIQKPKWDEQACYELALTCNNISEMQAKANKAAKHARENGWVKNYTWFNNPTDELKKYKFCVYVYTNGTVAYVGLTRTYRIKIRDYEHRNKKDGYVDVVKKYFDSINEDIPEPIILETDLTAEDAQYYEDYYRQKYENDGYLMLNIAKTGVGRGSVGVNYPKCTKEYCENKAKQYKTLAEFSKKEISAYNASRTQGWLKDYTWLKRQDQKIVTYEEAYKEAKKYKYIGEFATQSQRQYNAAYKKGWLKDYTWLKYKNSNRNYKRPNPTREQCFKEAKKFTKVKQFYNHKTTMCKFAREKGWYDDYIWFDSVYRSWTHKRCEQEAQKYTSLSEFEQNCYGGYHVSVKEGWISEFSWLK